MVVGTVAAFADRGNSNANQLSVNDRQITFGFPPILFLILLLAWTNLIGVSYIVLMPVFAKVVLHGGAQTYGFLMSSSGCGAMLGAITLASRKSFLGIEKIIAIAVGFFGAAG